MFTSPLLIIRGEGRKKYLLSYFKTLSIVPVLGIEPVTSCFAVKYYADRENLHDIIVT